jgi:CHAT domain-containing protein
MSPRLTSAICLLWCALPLASIAAGCPAEHDGRKLLAAKQVFTSAQSDVLAHVQQHDLDVHVVVHRGNQQHVHGGPSGRSGSEWVYVATAVPTRHEICVYPAFRHFGTDPPATSIDVLPAAGRRDVLQAMSDAGVLWATQTADGRAAAVEKYDFVARESPDPWLSDYARLNAALARVERYAYARALASFRHLTSKPGTSIFVRYMAQWGIGYVLNRRGEFALSKSALEAALRLEETLRLERRREAGAARTHRDRAEIMNLLGEVLVSEGEIDAGETEIREAKKLAGDDYQLLGLIHNNLEYASIQRADRDDTAQRQSHLAAGLRELTRAREYSMQAGDWREWSIIENNIGRLLERIGDLRRARAQFEGALLIIDTKGNPSRRKIDAEGDLSRRGKDAGDDSLRLKMLYRTLGNMYRTLGDYPRSASFLAEALKMAEQAEPRDAILLQCQLGTTHRLMGDLPRAITAHGRCKQLAEDAADLRGRVEALNELTIDFQLAGKDQEAWRAIQNAVKLRSRVNDADTRCNVLTRYALVLQARGSPEAQRVAKQAVEAAAGTCSPPARIDALAAAMHVSLAQGQRKQADSYGRQAIEAIEAVHANLDAERLGPAWSAHTQHVFTDLITMTLADREVPAASKWSAALALLERSRAISLRQQLSAADIPQDLLAQAPLLRALSELANTSAAETMVKPSTPGLPLAYYHDHALLTQYHLTGAKDVPIPRPKTTHELQRALGPGRAALVYLLTEQDAYLFVVTATTLKVEKLGTRTQVRALAAKVRDAVTVRPDTLTAALHELAQLILPSRALPPVDELLVTLDGELHAIPFAALDVGQGTGHYVPALQRFNVRVVPSLSAFFMAKPERRLKPSTDLAAFADPHFRMQGRAAGNTPGWTQRLDKLPASALEARNLQALFPADRVRVYSGPNATRNNLRSEMVRNAHVLHIASHGYFVARSPENVGFALSASSQGGRYDSGFVTLTELFTYRSRNQLVVISGCDTGLGQTQGGEGMMSVSRAFLAQGAPHVISTLWEVSDRVSADFMTRFYGRLKASRSVSKALRETQLEFLAARDTANPFFWAPYLLTTVNADDSIVLSDLAALAREAKR